MHRSLCRLVALVLTLASPAAWAQDVGSLDALAWLAGCWAGERTSRCNALKSNGWRRAPA